jgi:hypothetical protein
LSKFFYAPFYPQLSTGKPLPVDNFRGVDFIHRQPDLWMPVDNFLKMWINFSQNFKGFGKLSTKVVPLYYVS